MIIITATIASMAIIIPASAPPERPVAFEIIESPEKVDALGANENPVAVVKRIKLFGLLFVKLERVFEMTV